jgi:type VI secretion system protein ImpA
MSEITTLPALADGSAAGPNLELDPVFGDLERAARGKPETQYGNTIEPAVPPDWQETASLARSLLERTRDLRVMTHLAVARLHLDGLPGFAAGLQTICEYLETTWDQVHPQLDPEDDNDPMQRSNALSSLKDPARVLRPLRDLPFAGDPRTGRISWRDIAISNGTIEPEAGRARLSEAAIRAAFARTKPVELAVLHPAVATIQASLAAISTAFDTKARPGSAPDFDDLTRILNDIERSLQRYEPVADEAPDPPTEAQQDAETAAQPGHAARQTRVTQSFQAIVMLNSREEALHALELAAAYFRSNEPSSPLPLLIDRAKRLASLPFLEILRDLAPDGLMQAQIVVGTINEGAT